MSDLDVGPMVNLPMGLIAGMAGTAVAARTEGELMTQKVRILAGVR